MTLLAEGRKFGVSLVTANQFWHQLPTELRGALLSAGTHVLFRLSAADARVLAPELSVSGSRRHVAQLTTLPQGTALVRSGWAEPCCVRVPALPRSIAPESSVYERLHGAAVARYSTLRTTIESDIHRRLTASAPTNSHPENTHDAARDDEGQHGW